MGRTSKSSIDEQGAVSPSEVLQLCIDCNRENDCGTSADDASGWTLLHYLVLYGAVEDMKKMLQVPPPPSVRVCKAGATSVVLMIRGSATVFYRP